MSTTQCPSCSGKGYYYSRYGEDGDGPNIKYACGRCGGFNKDPIRLMGNVKEGFNMVSTSGSGRIDKKTGRPVKGGCFLTTACTEFAGMPDDCEALMLMRKLRDDYVAKLPDANELISEYYEFSPKIVAVINAMPKVDAAKHYEQMLEQIRDISRLVQHENYSEAKNSYFKMYDELRRLL